MLCPWLTLCLPLDIEYRELEEKRVITHWRRVSSLNTDERFIADMAKMLVSKSIVEVTSERQIIFPFPEIASQNNGNKSFAFSCDRNNMSYSLV